MMNVGGQFVLFAVTTYLINKTIDFVYAHQKLRPV